MAEERKSRNSFTRALEENQNIDERFRTLMHDTFDGLYKAMGQKGFLRWINTRKISERIRELIVEEFTKEDKEKYSNWAGYYTPGTNREKLKEGFINQSVASHESLHFLTDFRFTGEAFPTFIDEGLTEYLTREFEKLNTGNKNVRYTYYENVNFVEFLHNIMGDVLIRTYLTGTSKAFSEEFSTYITEDGKADTTALDNFYKFLDELHYALHPIKKQDSKETKKDIEEKFYPELRQYIGYIVANAIRKKAHDLEYYEDGKFKIEDAINDIYNLTINMETLFDKSCTFGFFLGIPTPENARLRETIFKNALTAVLQESHIPNEKIEEIVNASISPASSTVFQGKVNTQYPSIKKEILTKVISNLSGEDIGKGLIDKRLGNTDTYMRNGQFSITSFLMDTSLILDKMHIEKDLRQLVIDSAILRYVPHDVDKDLIKTLIDKHSKLYVMLYHKQQENKRNAIDSKFVKISDTKFIEKRDNKIFLLDYDEKTGTVLEHEMEEDYFYKLYGGKAIKNKTKKKYIDRSSSGRSKEYIIIFDEDFSTVTVNGKSCEVMSSPEKLGDSFLIEEAMRTVLDGIRDGKYVSILNDSEEPAKGLTYTGIIPDKRSRVINYGSFLRDLRGAMASIPKEFQKGIKENAIGSLICRTYLIKPENMKKLQDYIGNLSLEYAINDSVINKLYSFTEMLNQSRREYIEKESKHNAICLDYMSEENVKVWRESIKAKERRKEVAEFNQAINTFVITDSMACIVEPLEVKTDQEHYSTMDGVEYLKSKRAEYTTAVTSKIDYDAFCDRLKDAASTMGEDKRAKFIAKVIEKSVDLWYGCGSGYPGEERISDERCDLSEELREILTDRINGSAEVDITRVREIEKRFLELSEEEEKVCLGILEKRSPLFFENDDLKRDYELVKSIHGMTEIPEDIREKTMQEVKDASREKIKRKRKISAFIKLALNRDAPSNEEIANASKVIDFYEKKDKGVLEEEK